MLDTKEERIEDFMQLWEHYTDSDSDYLVTKNDEFMKYLIEEGFFTAPASTKYHGAYEGGLYDHSRAVFSRLAQITKDNGIEWQRPESPFIVAMFHDLCKCDQYIKVDDENGSFHYEYNQNTLLKGHGVKSIMVLSRFINLTEEEMLCIRFHMGAYEKDDWAEFDKAIKKYQTVLWTHTADMLASKVDEK